MENLKLPLSKLKPLLTPERWDKIEQNSKQSSDYILPILEDVYQYRNAAAIVRSVESCGFHKVMAMEKRNEFIQNLTVTKGAENWVEVERIAPCVESITKIKKKGYKIVAVSPENNATSLPDFKINEPVALVFGTEWNGVSQEILNIADETLSIPMYGFTKSFNVSVAAAICMYELKQKLIRSEIDFYLSEEKRHQLMIRWTINSIRSGEEIYQKILKENNWEDVR